jgi:hypothetical protein
MHDKDATPIEAIDFETLEESSRAAKESKQALNRKPILWFTFIALVLCAVLVFLFLPKYVENNKQRNSAEQIDEPPLAVLPKEISPGEINPVEILVAPIPEQGSELSPEELSAQKQEAEELLLQLIDKQKLLESKAVKKWAQEEYKIALTLGSSGDEHFRKQKYTSAISSYKDAVMILSDLEKNIAPTLALHLGKGELALTQAEKDTAIVHFELAKAIETKNIQAINGLKRAETIKELYTLLEQGGKLEAANRFVDAKSTYQKATTLDPLSTEAKTALGRVSSRLAENEFTRLINKGYSALKSRQYGDARAAFIAAQKLAPNSGKPKQGIAAIEQAVREEKLAALKTEAQHFEDIQAWSDAVKTYQQMLVVSPNLSIAQQGLVRNQKREAILSSLDEHINNKLRLSSENVVREAKQLLQEVALISNPGSKIKHRAVTLEELIQLAMQPVSITLQSDNQTDIAIFKVGKFGKFEQRKVDLKIGKYTIVGARPGFRDVRKTFTVTSNMSNKTIQVRCDEPI